MKGEATSFWKLELNISYTKSKFVPYILQFFNQFGNVKYIEASKILL